MVYTDEYQSVKNQGVGGFNLPEVATEFEDHEQQVRFNHNWIVSPKLVNQISFLVGRQDVPTISVNRGPRLVVQDAFTGVARRPITCAPRRTGH
jgi:hypothetical protein